MTTMNTDKTSTVTATVESYPAQPPPVGPPPPGQPAPGCAAPGYPANYAPNPAAAPYPYPPQQMVPPPVQTTALVVTYNRGAEPPAQVQCGRCGEVVPPFKRYEPGMFSWLIAGGLCLIGCCCFVWVPFVADSTKDAVFTCPKCTQELARVKRI